MSLDPTARVLELLQAQAPFCLATVVTAQPPAPPTAPADEPGSAFPVSGQKLIVRAGDSWEGTLGSPALDRAVAAAASAAMDAGEIVLARFDGDGQRLRPRRQLREIEAGTVEVSLEPMLPPPLLIIVGAGHIAVPLARFAKQVGFRVTVIDDRERFANRERFPDADHVIVDDFRRAIAAQEITRWTYLVLVTRGHEHDEATLERVVESPAPYIGMIGSRRRVLLVEQRLKELGVPDRFLDRLYAPIGLDIGARTADEIALAIAAELVNVRRAGAARSLALRRRAE